MVTDAAHRLFSRRLIPFYGRPILNSLHTWSQMLPLHCLPGGWSHSVEGSYWTACIHVTDAAHRLFSRRLIPFYGRPILNSLHTWSQMLPLDCLLGDWSPFCGRLILNSLHTWSQMLPSDCLLGDWSHSMEGPYWTACIHGHRCCPQIVF